MAGPSILKLALFASAALALPFDLQDFSRLNPRHWSPGANPPFPQFNPQAGEFPHGGIPMPTGTAVEPSSFVGPTGTAAPVPTGLMKRDHFPHGLAPPPFGTAVAPTGAAPTGFMPHPTEGFLPGPIGFKSKRMLMPTGTAGFPAPTGGFPAPTGGFPAPTGGFHDFEPPMMHHHQARQQFGVARKHDYEPHFPVFAPGPEMPMPSAPTGTMPPFPTST